jgi:casein kinase II subunit alpha
MPFSKLTQVITDMDVRFYSMQILLTINHMHKLGVMHRDIKAGNVLINPKLRSVRLIDFGLSEMYQPSMEFNVRVASRYYRAPELIFSVLRYD